MQRQSYESIDPEPKAGIEVASKLGGQGGAVWVYESADHWELPTRRPAGLMQVKCLGQSRLNEGETKQVPRCATVQWFITETANRLDQMVLMVLPDCFRVAD